MSRPATLYVVRYVVRDEWKNEDLFQSADIDTATEALEDYRQKRPDNVITLFAEVDA